MYTVYYNTKRLLASNYLAFVFSKTPSRHRRRVVAVENERECIRRNNKTQYLDSRVTHAVYNTQFILNTRTHVRIYVPAPDEYNIFILYSTKSRVVLACEYNREHTRTRPQNRNLLIFCGCFLFNFFLLCVCENFALSRPRHNKPILHAFTIYIYIYTYSMCK